MAWMKQHGGSLRGPDATMENKTSSIASKYRMFNSKDVASETLRVLFELTLTPVMRGGTCPKKTRSRSNINPLSLNPSNVVFTKGSTVSNRTDL
jgi:hypothetical protein